MKNSILFTIMLLPTLTTPASENPNYRSFKEFNNDTLAYLKYNFDKNDYYVGKTVDEFLENMELKIYRSNFLPAIWGDKKTRSAVFYFEKSENISRIIIEKGSEYLLKINVFLNR